VQQALPLYAQFVLDARRAARHAPRFMVKRRSSFDPLLPVHESRWLCVRRMDHALIEFQRLESGADLKAVFVHALASHADAGWTLERFSSDLACAFCRRDQERRLIAIECFDPNRPMPTRNLKFDKND
jgi:hypothetical protein